MRIGIITFHRAINYGAVLQSYALQQFLLKKNFDVCIIDYENDHIKKQYKSFFVSSLSFKKIALSLLYYRTRKIKNKKFKKFRDEYLVLSNDRNIKKCNLQYEGKKYDYIISGSDQVWNPKATDWDDSYLLSFIDNEKKISYAASLGTNVIDEKTKAFLKNNLEDFKSISIREIINKEDLENLLKRDVIVNIDPVFLLTNSDWNNFNLEKNKVKQKYVFIYCLHEQNCYKYGKELAEKNNLKIVYVPNSLRVKLKGKKVTTAGVTEFLNYIKNAEYVVTDSFHVTAFSIIFRKNFFVVLKQKKQELNFRLTNLLNKFELDSQIIYSDSDLNKKPNYNNIEYKIGLERSKASEYFDVLRKW